MIVTIERFGTGENKYVTISTKDGTASFPENAFEGIEMAAQVMLLHGSDIKKAVIKTPPDIPIRNHIAYEWNT